MLEVFKSFFNRRHSDSRPRYAMHLTTAECNKFSMSGHVRVESQVAIADYSELKRTVQVSSPDSSPLGAVPSDKWVLKGFMGLNGYLDFSGGTSPEATTANLELWAKDEQNDKWFKLASKSNVAHREEFRFENTVRHRSVFLRVSGFTGTAADCNVYCTAE